MKMWARFRASVIKKDKQKIKQSQQKSDLINVNEEYLCAVRTKSYTDFFSKFQLHENSPSQNLLDHSQEAITSILHSSSLFSSSSSSSSNGLKSLLSNYFDISAEASTFCSHLLQTLTHLQHDYKFIQTIINTAIINDHHNHHSSHDFVVSELRSRVILNNPFTHLNTQKFEHIHDKHSSVLNRLKSNRKTIVRKIRLIKLFNKASKVCVTTALGLLAAAAMFLAAHTLTALLMGPAVLAVPIKPLKKRLFAFRVIKYGDLNRVVEQLDVAAKGAYILNRDFDTMSRLVARLGDEIEHNKAMIRLCLDRREDRYSYEVLKEIKKYEFGFKKKVEELEEHVYLCLVTINRARAMVVNEISKGRLRLSA